MRRALNKNLPCRNAGQKSRPPHYSFESRDYDIFQVIYVARGELVFSSRGTLRPLLPGDMALLRMGSSFRLHTRNRGYGGVYFIAAGEYRPEFRGDSLPLTADDRCRSTAEVMLAEIRSPGQGSQEILIALGYALARAAMRLDRQPGTLDSSFHWAEVARGALEATLTTGRGAREVLASLDLGYRQLARHFARAFGVSPKKYQISARIREAQRLLSDTRQEITAIAFELGYPSSQHFATQFRAEAGVSPSQWRAGHGR